jgi:GNAT superfamily N-acetyltransferase
MRYEECDSISSRAGVRVRLAQQEDLPDVCAIDHDAFSPYGTAELPAILRARWDVFPQGFVIAEEGDCVIGFGTSEKWLDEHEPAMNENPFQSHNPGGRTFCITAMAVRRAWRGYGVGAAILEALVQIAKDQQCRVVVLETTHAQTFYLQRGFRETGQRHQFDTWLTILTLTLENGR